MMWLLRWVSIPIVAPAAGYFVYWGILFGEQRNFGLMDSAIAAIGVSGYVWLGLGDQSPGPIKTIFLGAFLVGSIGFDLGFFGPLLFLPEASWHPLLGLFITGPLGMALGAVGGVWYWLLNSSKSNVRFVE